MSGIKSDPVRYFGRQVRKERLAAGWTLASRPSGNCLPADSPAAHSPRRSDNDTSKRSSRGVLGQPGMPRFHVR